MRTNVPAFTHLKVYSSYSLGVGLNTPAEICAYARRSGYASVALTDVGGTYGFVEFHLAAKQHELKPVYGTVVEHYPVGVRKDDRYSLTLIAVSREGLRNVAAVASFCATAAETGTALDIEVLGANAAGVVAYMGGIGSEIAGLLLREEEEDARRVAGAFKEIFGDRLFIEIQDHGAIDERALAARLLSLAAATRTAPLLTHEVRYVEKRIRELYGALRGIRDAGEARDFFRIDREPRDWSMKSPLEMSQLRPFYEAAFDNASRVDEMVAEDFMDHLDAAWTEEDAADAGALRAEIFDRCASALRGLPGEGGEEKGLAASEVLAREVDEALAEGLGPTLLLFHRVVSHLREARVEMGPATGLSLQSLCAYLLGITCFDPYRYDGRHYPAFDSRINDTREFELQLTPETRSDAVHALFTLFGFGQVAYLPAIERVTPSKALRMAASVVSVPEEEYREIREAMERRPGVPIESLYDENENLGRLYRRSLAARDLLRKAALLEGLPVGVIHSRRSLALSPVPLTDCLGHSIDSDSGDLFVQAGRDVFPFSGVFRVDVTSLNALSVAVRADEEIRREGIADYGWERVPIDDAEVWRRIQSGDVTGVFLFEGQTTVKLRETFELGGIEDLTNFLALMRSRDGDQSLGQRIGAFQSGAADASGEDDVVGGLLRGTRGQVLYDEQVRDVVCALTGITPSEGWRIFHDLRDGSPGALAGVRTRFMMGAAEKGVPVEGANRWFERLLHLAQTTISHKRVFVDALLVYKLFFLKARHEAVFYASLLNSNVENEAKAARYLGALRARGLVLPVDANRSGVAFTVEDGMVRTGFQVLRGFDDEKAERVVKARARGPFDSLEEFVRRVGRRHLGRDEFRALIEGGAFDSFGLGRTDLAKQLSVLLGRRRTRLKGGGEPQLELPLGD